jgi:hypothetical protein
LSSGHSKKQSQRGIRQKEGIAFDWMRDLPPQIHLLSTSSISAQCINACIIEFENCTDSAKERFRRLGSDKRRGVKSQSSHGTLPNRLDPLS